MKVKHIGLVVGAIAVAAVVAVLVVTQVVMPERARSETYDRAVSLGNSSEAVAAFETLGDYKDSKERIERIKTDSRNNVAVGNDYWLGSYEQDNVTSNGKEDIVWRVLAVKDGKALIVSKYVLDSRMFNANPYRSPDWYTSDLNYWLQNEFAWSAGLGDVADRITLLSSGEANKYLPSNDDRMCVPTAYAIAQGASSSSTSKVDGIGTCDWWLLWDGLYGTYVSSDGTLCSASDGFGGGDHFPVEDHGVRPALWVDL